MRQQIKLILIAVITVIIVVPVYAQGPTDNTGGGQFINTVNTAVPFLRIAPDARSGSMGDLGVAISPDASGWFWNPAKMAFIDNNFGMSITYTPWLKQLVPDIYLANISAFSKIDEVQTIGGSLRYFSLGNIQFTDASGNNLQEFRPNEFAIDAGYSRKLSDVFSTGVMLRFIYSNLAKGMEVTSGAPIRAGIAGAADVSFFYTNDIEISGMPSNLSFGLNISNLGSKITYTDDMLRDFIPANLGFGSALTMDIDDHNAFTFAFDVNKLLVPTPDPADPHAHKELAVPSAVFSSFGDAPGGFSEEMQELMLSFGVEYWYDQQFAIRGGYFYEAENKGNRQFLTLGLGLKYTAFGLNFSYLVPTSNQKNPLDNTLRFSLLFDFDALSAQQ